LSNVKLINGVSHNMIITSVRISNQHKQYVEEQCINLSKFVRMKLDKLEESQKPARIQEIQTNDMEV